MAEKKKKKDAAGTAKKTGAKARKKEPAITRQDALQIAQAFLADKGAFGVNGVRDGIDENLAPYIAADIRLHGMLNDCWIVECGLDPFQVVDGSTMLVGISKTTGDIVYAGILSIA